MESKDEGAYKKKYFAFIDILGFRNLVKRTTTDQKLFKDLHAILKTIHEFKEDRNSHHQMLGEMIDSLVAAPEMNEFADMKPDTENMVFSDSIVLTGSPDFAELIGLLSTISRLTLDLFEIGIFIRGGLVIGDIYFDDSIVFGPALVDAYDLESNKADYPRVVVVDKIAHELLAMEEPVESQHAAPINMMLGHYKNLIRQDSDGLYYVNFFNEPMLDRRSKWRYSESGKSGKKALLKDFRSIIISKLAEAGDDERIARKIRWIALYFNSILKKSDGVQTIDV